MLTSKLTWFLLASATTVLAAITSSSSSTSDPLSSTITSSPFPASTTETLSPTLTYTGRFPENTNVLTVRPLGDSTKCLGFQGGEGTTVNISDCNTAIPTQKWFLSNGEALSVGSNLCLDAGTTEFTNGTPLVIQTCQMPNIAQQTFVWQSSQGALMLYETTYCLDLAGDGMAQLWSCDVEDTSQQWAIFAPGNVPSGTGGVTSSAATSTVLAATGTRSVLGYD